MKKFAFSTGALYPMLSEDALQAVYDAGFPCAELMPQAFSDVTPQFATKVEKIGVHVTSIHYPLSMFPLLYNACPSMREEAKQFADRLTSMAKTLGTKVIVIHPHNPVSVPEQYERLEKPVIENLQYLAQRCATNNIVLGMENNPKGPGSTAKGLLDYISQYFGEYECMKPVVDTTEACEANCDPVAFMLEAKPFHVHLSDFVGAQKHIPMGQGAIDWNGIAKVMKQNNYQGIYTLEPSYKHYLTDIPQKLRKAYESAVTIFQD